MAQQKRLRLTEKERDLIEAIRNFRKSLGIMEKQEEFEWYINQTLHYLMYEAKN